MKTVRNDVSRAELARRALAELYDGVLDAAMFTGCQPVDPDEMPSPFGQLLLHHDHMTTRLGAFCGRPVQLRVVNSEQIGEAYSRLIVLTPQGEDRVVEVGFVRIDLGCTSPAVRDMILAGKTPLGDILIGHNVLRRIELQWYFRLAPDCPLMAHFGRPLEAAYGRLGVIHCDDRPAIRLLEVVSGR